MPPEFLPNAPAPEWAWWIVFYFFLGGMAAGAYFLAGLLELAGDPRDRDAVRIAHYVAFPLVAICGLLLTLDLGRPERFWHMLFQSGRFPVPAFKAWSPISFGSWIVLGFSVLAFLSFVDAVVTRNREERILHRGPFGRVFSVLGTIAGFALAGYTGVLLAATSQPLWTQSQVIGALFTASAASTGLAAILLLLRLRRRHYPSTEHKLEQADTLMMVLELALLVLFLVSLGALAGPAARAAGAIPFSSPFGVLVLGIGVVLFGLLTPMVLYFRPRTLGPRTPLVASVLGLVGGFLLRYAVIMLPQGRVV
jgi:protein NrfD